MPLFRVDSVCYPACYCLLFDAFALVLGENAKNAQTRKPNTHALLMPHAATVLTAASERTNARTHEMEKQHWEAAAAAVSCRPFARVYFGTIFL